MYSNNIGSVPDVEGLGCPSGKAKLYRAILKAFNTGSTDGNSTNPEQSSYGPFMYVQALKALSPKA